MSAGSTKKLIDRCAGLRRRPSRDREFCTYLAVLSELARRIQSLDTEIAEHFRQIKVIIEDVCPQIIAEAGAGPISSAQIYTSWSHPGRCRNEAAFAKLGGTSPIEASSGQVDRHRLNRGGDRQLNRALHTIIISRERHDLQTQAYIAKRIRQGKSCREARRCLKRYLGRHFFRLLENPPEQEPNKPRGTP